MSKRQVLMILGVWVIIFQFFGIPENGLKGIGIATGLIIILIAYGIRSGGNPPPSADMPYRETKQP